MADTVRVGVGGWTFDPWRETFYPKSVKKTAELHYASRQLTAIEINGTFYRLQSPSTFARWRDETPDGFVFSVKAHRLTTYRKVLDTAWISLTALGLAPGASLSRLFSTHPPTEERIARLRAMAGA